MGVERCDRFLNSASPTTYHLCIHYEQGQVIGTTNNHCIPEHNLQQGCPSGYETCKNNPQDTSGVGICKLDKRGKWRKKKCAKKVKKNMKKCGKKKIAKKCRTTCCDFNKEVKDDADFWIPGEQPRG